MEKSKIVFETERLIIREVTTSDWTFLLSCYNDDEVMKYIPNSVGEWDFSRLQQKYKKINADESSRYGLWVVELKKGRTLIGEVGLFNSFNDTSKLELGYILDQKQWRKGYGKELVNGLIEYSKSSGDIKHLVARMFKSNVASAMLSESCGMVKTDEGVADNGIEYCQYELSL
ncbi:N-acetyltransferase [Prolixibacteraceae bacterium JC049]|nr:N-acetyltransferase [Prolixibacteraceae bacterium JC049]